MELQFELEMDEVVENNDISIYFNSEPLIPENKEESEILNSLYESNSEIETDSDHFSLTSETQIEEVVNFINQQQESKKRKIENTIQTESKVSKKTRML